MEGDQFNELFVEVVNKCGYMLGAKATEYATGVDRLHNFKVASHLQGVSNRDALAGMMAKHTASVYDLCGNEACAPLAVWDEKIIDHINYLILLRAIVVEELEGK